MIFKKIDSKDKGEYKFIKDLNHKNFPGPGFIRTKTGWSNREEKTSVGKSKTDSRSALDEKIKKNPPLIKLLDKFSENEVFVEGLAEGIYFKILFSLAVESSDEIISDKVKENINRTILNYKIDSMNIEKEGYKKILKDLYDEFDLIKVYWCKDIE